MISYSQNFEDVILERYFKDKNDGFYIDIGAADTKIHSVTKHFYDKGWHGINVEPSPVLYGLLQQERTRDINLNIVVCEQDGLVEFFDIPKAGLSSINKEYVDSAMNNILQLNYDGNKLDAINTSLLESSRLENLFEKYTKNVEVDFLKIDVEGAEEQVIKSNNWSLFRPKVLVIEATLPNTQIESYKLWEKVLLQADYSFVYFDGLNRFYLRDDLAEGRKFFSYPPCVFDDFTRSSEVDVQRVNDRLHIQLNELQERYKDIQSQLYDTINLNNELKFKYQDILKLNSGLTNSLSWKITSPLRWGGWLLIALKTLTHFPNFGDSMFQRYKGNRLVNRFTKEEINRLLIKCLTRPRRQVEGYNVFGYFSIFMGQAEVVRAFVDGLIKGGENITLFDFYVGTHQLSSGRPDLKYRKYYFSSFKYRTNVFFIDLNVLKRLKSQIPRLFKNKKNIVAFWWEFESGFEDRIPILNEFDEVYVFSDFIKDILNKVESRQFIVTKIDYPFSKNWVINEEPSLVRSRYNLEDKFCFFFNFDYYSSYNRKNPEAILKALSEEFPDEQNVVFVVKTCNSERFEEKEKRFISLVNDYGLGERVRIINDQLSRDAFMTLLNSMDCYISLHRGEGLGLGILEALALGKTVIATNYGGNTEYMHNPNCYAVPYTLVSASDDYVVYKYVKQWAEPDISEAKKYMREVYFQISR